MTIENSANAILRKIIRVKLCLSLTRDLLNYILYYNNNMHANNQTHYVVLTWEIIVKTNKSNFGKHFPNHMVHYGVLLKHVALSWLALNGVINIFWLDIHLNATASGTSCPVRHGLNTWSKGALCNLGHKVSDWVLHACYKLLLFF